VAVEVLCKELFGEGNRLFVVRRIEAVREPGFLARLDDYRGERLAELVRMYLEPAVLGLLECEGECRKRFRRPEPDEAALARVDVRLEHGFMALACPAVDAVGPDDEVGVREWRVVLDVVLEMVGHAELRAPLLEDAQQPLALDAAETVATGGRGRAAVVDVDVVPVVEAARDRRVRGPVGGLEAFHGAVGEDDPPAECVVGTVALVDLHPGPRQGLAEEYCGIEPGGPAAEAGDALHRGITGVNSLNVNYIRRKT